MAGFSIEALTQGIANCKKNIGTFEEAIDKERATIKEYYGMIETVQRKEREFKVSQEHIEVVREN